MIRSNITHLFLRGSLTLSICTSLLGLMLLIGCAPPAPEPGVTDVGMTGLRFNPMVVTINQGETVRWTNDDPLPIPHTVTSGEPEDANAGSVFDSGTLLPGQTYSFTFDTPGTYVYFCRFHFMEGMRDAQVIVNPAP